MADRELAEAEALAGAEGGVGFDAVELAEFAHGGAVARSDFAKSVTLLDFVGCGAAR